MALAMAQPVRLESLFENLLDRAQCGVAAAQCGGVPIYGITGDSRAVEPGSCFVATVGTAVDGHDFVGQAIEAGATAVVAQRAVDVPPDVGLAIVPDSRAALAKLAAVFYGLQAAQQDKGLRVAGVTGTNGKTTVAYLLRSILAASGERAALLSTIAVDLIERRFEAAMTTAPPVELAQWLTEAAEAGAAYAVMETSSHALDQRRCDGVRFAAGVFTNLTGDHLDYHATTAHYRAAKKRLFDGLDADATAVVNADDPASAALLADCRAACLRFGFGEDADVRAKVRASGTQGSAFTLSTPAGTVDVQLPLVGRHNVSNALAAAAAAVALGAAPEAIAGGLERVGSVPGRMERVGPVAAGLPTVLVDYAHTDDALENVLAAARPLTAGRLIVLFGCGGDRDATKRPRMGRAAAAGADEIVVTSDNPRSESPQKIIEQILEGIPPEDRGRVHIEADREAAIALAVGRGGAGDVVLLAGKGHETYQIIGTERLPLDDRVAAAAALARRHHA